MVHSRRLYFPTLLCGALPQSWRNSAALAVLADAREGRLRDCGTPRDGAAHMRTSLFKQRDHQRS